MSLAEQLTTSEPPAKTMAPAPAPMQGIDKVLRLAMSGAADRRAKRDLQALEIPDFAISVDLLTRASETLQSLQDRCKRLEETIKIEAEHFTAELRAAQNQGREWERRANLMKAQLHDCESRISEIQLRAEAAVYRAETAEARVALAEQHAADATKQVWSYHQKIMAAFGTLP